MASGQLARIILRNSLSRCSRAASSTIFRLPSVNPPFSERNHRPFHSSIPAPTKLAEVGKIEPIKVEGNYDTGQLFIHRVFGYRGVTLFPWTAKIEDRDRDYVPQDGEKFENTTAGRKRGGSMKATKNSETHTYYQVLIDERDCPHINHRCNTEQVTCLVNQSDSSNKYLYSISGLDYVAHKDIIPYSTCEKAPFQHHLFDKFLAPRKDWTEGQEMVFEPQQTLMNWKVKNHAWLELSDVYKETTENIRVTVIPFYMGSQDKGSDKVHWWRYCIRMENLGDRKVTLRERNWKIFSLSGTMETLRGRGVVGQEPEFTKDLPAFQYSSHVSLQAPSGHMWGNFRMERENGESFDVRIPSFELQSGQDDPNDPSIIGN